MIAPLWMDRNGFILPTPDCSRCGEKLSDENGPRPAESYLGTYTGLCYRCAGLPAYKVRGNEDGSQTWSYPPACPSWRRERQERSGYPDCEECGGRGTHGLRAISGWPGSGTYQTWCEPCSERRGRWRKERQLEAIRPLLERCTPPPKRKHQKIPVKISLREEPFAEEIEAETSDTEGLVIHRPRGGESKVWLITHVASGEVLTQAPTKKLAHEVAAALNGLVDWTISKEELLQIKGLLTAVSHIQEACK